MKSKRVRSGVVAVTFKNTPADYALLSGLRIAAAKRTRGSIPKLLKILGESALRQWGEMPEV